MSIPSSERVHATTVAIGGAAVMIMGFSGSGKSDLALRLIDRGAVLVSDDYTQITRIGDHLSASAPATIKGKIEVRGLGILTVSVLDSAPVRLGITLNDPVIRLPTGLEEQIILGVPVPVMPLAGFEASAPLKVEMALRRLLG
jgi:serine kinase of HPr protein (carbohydrate metabolism regulator)